MRSFKILITALVSLFILLACNNSANDNNKTVVKAATKSTQLKEGGDIQKVEVTEIEESLKIQTNKDIQEAKQKHKVLNKLGINTTDDGKIVIEPKKTREFFENLAKILTKEGEEFKNKNADIKSDDLGIKASKDKIIIDTTKTKSFLEKLSKDLEDMAKDITKEIEGI